MLDFDGVLEWVLGFFFSFNHSHMVNFLFCYGSLSLVGMQWVFLGNGQFLLKRFWKIWQKKKKCLIGSCEDFIRAFQRVRWLGTTTLHSSHGTPGRNSKRHFGMVKDPESWFSKERRKGGEKEGGGRERKERERSEKKRKRKEEKKNLRLRDKYLHRWPVDEHQYSYQQQKEE